MAPVNGIEPSTGLHIWWQGLWMTRAPGISLNQLSYVTRRDFLKDTILDLLQVSGVMVVGVSDWCIVHKGFQRTPSYFCCR